jgi:hypothetical protein
MGASAGGQHRTYAPKLLPAATCAPPFADAVSAIWVLQSLVEPGTALDCRLRYAGVKHACWLLTA